jgi:hypothetical protein
MWVNVSGLPLLCFDEDIVQLHRLALPDRYTIDK